MEYARISEGQGHEELEKKEKGVQFGCHIDPHAGLLGKSGSAVWPKYLVCSYRGLGALLATWEGQQHTLASGSEL